MIAENVYGHARRLGWIASRLDRRDRVVELGCGTGTMITLPLLSAGYDVRGTDLHAPSIAFGRDLLRRAGLDPGRLRAADLAELDVSPDVIIASEVLEHMPDDVLHATLGLLRARLRPGGRLLLTVPNGYGWFEVESFLWFRARLGAAVERLRLDRLVRRLKAALFGVPVEDPYPPSTLADSPHVQRFTRARLRALCARHGFAVEEITGSVLFAGPFSNLLFTGIGAAMRLNGALGRAFPGIAAGFFAACRRVPDAPAARPDTGRAARSLS